MAAEGDATPEIEDLAVRPDTDPERFVMAFFTSHGERKFTVRRIVLQAAQETIRLALSPRR